jgi:hypothetical protein
MPYDPLSKLSLDLPLDLDPAIGDAILSARIWHDDCS